MPLRKPVDVMTGEQGRPTIILSLGGIRGKALVDTSASCSLLRHDVLKKITKAKHTSIYVKPVTTPVQAVNGMILDLKGCTTVKPDKRND